MRAGKHWLWDDPMRVSVYGMLLMSMIIAILAWLVGQL